MAFELSKEQFRIMIFYDWKNGLNFTESHVCLIIVLEDLGTFRPNRSQLVPQIREWEVGCLWCTSIRTTTNCSNWRNDGWCSIIDWRSSTIWHTNRPSVAWRLVRWQYIQLFTIISGYERFCARWVPNQFINDQKQVLIQFWHKSLDKFEEGWSQLVFDIITNDESWHYHYDPETREQLEMYVPKDAIRPSKVQQNKRFGKGLMTILFTKFGLIKSILLKYSASVSTHGHPNNYLSQSFDVISQKRGRTRQGGLILYDNNTRPHLVWTTTEFWAENRMEYYPNPLHSLDLSLCEFFLFSKLKRWPHTSSHSLRRNHFVARSLRRRTFCSVLFVAFFFVLFVAE